MKIMLNGEERECQEDATVAAVVAELGLSKKRIAVEVNRNIIPREEYAACRLHAGDVIEIVHFVGGG